MTVLSKDYFSAAAKLAVFYLFCLLRTAMKPSRIRALAGALVFAALVSSALTVFALNANAAPPALTLPSFQELINKPAASSPDSASAAASGTADTAASPASDVDLTRSLDTVISTLDNDRERTALVAKLKKLRDAKRDAESSAQPAASSAASDGSGAAVLPEVAAASSASSSTAASSVVAAITPKTGLLGAIASGLSSLEADFSRGRTPLNYWGGRLNAAGNELFTIVSGQSRESFGHTLLNYCLMLTGWGVCAFLLCTSSGTCTRVTTFISGCVPIRPPASF